VQSTKAPKFLYFPLFGGFFGFGVVLALGLGRALALGWSGHGFGVVLALVLALGFLKCTHYTYLR